MMNAYKLQKLKVLYLMYYFIAAYSFFGSKISTLNSFQFPNSQLCQSNRYSNQALHAYSRSKTKQYKSVPSKSFIPREEESAVKGSYLLPPPPKNSIGNFFDNTTELNSFIQCYMIAIGSVDGSQYGVGYPMDMPVMLTYFEGNELKPVKPGYPNYDHLMNHISMQLDDNDMQLYQTPMVLTLQGDFDDKDMKSFYPNVRGINDDIDEEVEDENDNNDDSEDDEDVEMTLEQLLSMEEEYEDDEDFDIDDDDQDTLDNDNTEDDEASDEVDDNGDMASFWSSSPAGKLSPEFDNMPDYEIVPGDPNIEVAEDAIVTDEDVVSLRKAHRKADRIMSYAEDVVLIASFHYRKKNFHLVKLLEPIVIVGKRMNHLKGYYFTLLDDEESNRVTPKLEELLLNRKPDPTELMEYSSEKTNNKTKYSKMENNNDRRTNEIPTKSVDNSSNEGLKKSKRRWSNRLVEKRKTD